MSTIFRSEAIEHYKLIIPRENAWQIMNMLGDLNLIHIVPSSVPILSKPFTSQIRRCEDSLQKIYSLEQVLIKNRMYKPRLHFSPTNLDLMAKFITNRYHEQLQKDQGLSILDEIDDEVQGFWKGYEGYKKQSENLVSKLNFYRENIAIIKAGENYFGIKNFSHPSEVAVQSMSDNYSQVLNEGNGITMKCGVISIKEEARFSRTIFRITRGNSFIKFIPMNQIFEKVTPHEEDLVVYYVLVPAKADSYFERKLSRFVNSYNQLSGETYRLPTSPSEYIKVQKQLSDQYTETEHLLSMVEKQEKTFYLKLLGSEENADDNGEQLAANHNLDFKKIQAMKIYLLKELEIFTQLNEMELYNNFLQAEIFIRKNQIENLQGRLTQFQKKSRLPSGHLIPFQELFSAAKKRPTLFDINSYTCSAQEIVETYGVPQYQQANPALFTTVTFPFLFGVMFGDIGHGSLLFLFGLLLVFLHPNTIRRFSPHLGLLLPHRYLFAMMGFFATYCGFIYNDYLSVNLNLFGSCYDLQNATEAQAIQRIEDDCVYPFGVDPVWAVAENNLNYLNSLKMKISVIIAVVHMTVGVLVKASNSLYFKRKIEFYFEFIPQLLFLVLVFGYMDFLIIYKWLKDWGYGNVHAPSIITTMINLPLAMGQTDKECCHGGEPMWGTTTDTSQDQVQVLILVIAVLCIPTMLLVKPLYEINKIKKHKKRGQKMNSRQNSLEENFQEEILESHKEQEIEMVVMNEARSDDLTESRSDKDSLDDKNMDHMSDIEQHEPSEIFVHQIIETIEYVLGCISNTASYLRLWALSLAHSQLSEVFLEKTVEGPIGSGYAGIPGMILLFPTFVGATFGVLMCMDVMECFLHTLRLHWVEFQNKFYKGDGYIFKSFNFVKKINDELSSLVDRYQ